MVPDGSSINLAYGQQQTTKQKESTMKQIDITVFGITVPYSVPESVEEFNQLAGDPEAAYKASLQQVLAHSSAGDFRSTICDIFEGKEVVVGKNEDGTDEKYKLDAPLGTRLYLFGKEPVTAEEVEKDGKKITVYTNSKGKKLSEEQAAQVKRETEKSYFDRVVAEHGKTPEDFKSIIELAVRANPFNPAKSERKSAESRVGKTALRTAEKIIEYGTWDNAARQLTGLLGRVIDVSNPDTRLLILAQAVQENEKREAEARKLMYLTA